MTRLTAAGVRSAKIPGKYYDGGGLFLLIRTSGSKELGAPNNHHGQTTGPRLGRLPVALPCRSESNSGRIPQDRPARPRPSGARFWSRPNVQRGHGKSDRTSRSQVETGRSFRKTLASVTLELRASEDRLQADQRNHFGRCDNMSGFHLALPSYDSQASLAETFRHHALEHRSGFQRGQSGRRSDYSRSRKQHPTSPTSTSPSPAR